MPEKYAVKAGSALLWKGLQLGGVKVIFLIRLVVLARLLTPDDFGLLAVSMVAINIMSGLTDLGMVPALVQRHETEDSHRNVAWTVGFVRALLIASTVVVSAPWVADLFNEPRATIIISALAFRPIIESLTSIGIADLVRTLRFRQIAYVKLPEALANTIVAVALAPSLGVWALVAGALAGPIVAVIGSYGVAPYRPRLSFDRSTTKSLIQFGRWIFLIGIIGVIGSSVLRLVITRQLGTAELGLYYLAASLAFIPSEISGQVIGDVTFPLYARLQQNREKLGRAFRSVLTAQLAVLGPVSALLIALAPALVETALGPKWEGTVPIIQVIALVNIVGLLGDAAAPILKGVGRPDKLTVTIAVHTSLLIVFAWLFTETWQLVGAALAWLPSIAVSQLIIVKYLRDLVARPFLGLARPAVVITVVSILGGLISAFLYDLYPALLGLLVAASVSVVSIGLALWIFDGLMGLGLVDDFSAAFPQIRNLRFVKARSRSTRSSDMRSNRHPD